MKSPFPGMDPFIEHCGLWEDFHLALIGCIRDHLNDVVPERYLVRAGERGYVVLANKDGEKRHLFKPDVTVSAVAPPHGPTTASATVLAEPATEPQPMSVCAFIEEEFRETFIEIQDADSDGALVTCVEVLSPTNKRPNSPGWDLFFRKRQGLLLGRKANLVEIDLLRGGDRMPMKGAWPTSPYTLLVAEKSKAPICLVWPAYFHRPLPPIPVPLLAPDQDIQLDLQPMIAAIYARSHYRRSIDYSGTLKPTLTAEESAWLTQLLHQRSNSA